MSTSVQTIIDSAQQDFVNLIGSNHPALIDYTNRTHLEILRYSRWKFLLSGPQQFLTVPSQTDYWIGPAGSAAPGTVDTGLNLTAIQSIKKDAVFDRSNYHPLAETLDAPMSSGLMTTGNTARSSMPALWRNSPDTPSVLNIYPAANNQNIFQPVPYAPIANSLTTAGSLAARTYYLRCTFVDSAGLESSASDEAMIWIPSLRLCQVMSPKPSFAQNSYGVLYSHYNVYAAVSPNSETLQNSSPIAIGTNWTEPSTGLIGGPSAYPSQNLISPMQGYLIEFRYWQARVQLTQAAQNLQIPDDYIDVVVSGVNWKLAQMLRKSSPALVSQQDVDTYHDAYRGGLTGIIRDKNLFPRSDFIYPDAAAVQSSFGGFDYDEIFSIPTD